MRTKKVGAVIVALLLVATTLGINVASAGSMSPFDTANQNAFFDVPYPTNGKITPGFNPQYGLPREYPAEYFKPNPIFDWMRTAPRTGYQGTPNVVFDWMRTAPRTGYQGTPNVVFDWMRTAPRTGYQGTPNVVFDWMRTSPENADYSKPETWRGMDPFGNSNTKGD
ncbi:hypothetical protein CW714_06175 [Methanophagales archaeon]|nr:MAG: hypothetical protein CW714_06175 [Methanophagales archaeon]